MLYIIKLLEDGFARTGVKKNELAAACDITPPAVTGWLATGRVDKAHYPKISQMLKIPISSLYAYSENLQVPVVGMMQLGDKGWWSELEYPTSNEGGFIDVPTSDKESYSLRILGDSMMPTIRNGWYVVVEPNNPLVISEFILLKLNDSRSAVKELKYENDDEVCLTSVNQEHKTLIFKKSEIDKLHYVAFIAPPSKHRL